MLTTFVTDEKPVRPSKAVFPGCSISSAKVYCPLKRAPLDRNYQTILVSDASYSSVHELHDAAVKIWSYKGFVRTTDQVLNDFPWQNWIDPGLKQ